MIKDLIAFAGYAGAGKDSAARPLIRAGYARRCFGDTIKGQVDELVKKHLGFSAFTEDREQKAIIRTTLESWGEANYSAILTEYFANLPTRAVNTRICKRAEAEKWVSLGGVIVEIRRPKVVAETPWAAEQLQVLRERKLIHTVIENWGNESQLHEAIQDLFELV
jgi:hypothetical protein